MGAGRWDSSAYDTYRTTNSTSTKSPEENLKTDGMSPSLDPRGVTTRESRDSDHNPNSTGIIIDIDVTGSMGFIANTIVQKGLGILFESILDRKPVSDPHIMFMANGDVYYDHAPLQVSQFEADSRIIEQLTSIYLEKGGGGNDSESYTLPWYFAAFHTSMDCIEKRGKKGYLFTIGDECVPPDLDAEHIESVLGYKPQSVPTNKELLRLVERSFHVFHLIIEEGSYARSCRNNVTSSWRDILGQRAINVSDHTKLAEIIVSLIEVTEGRDANEVAASWSGDTSMVVAKAVKDLTPVEQGAEVVRL